MSKAEKFIKENTKKTYNYNSYVTTPTPWLSPDQARKAVEIAREETLLEVAAWISDTFIFSKHAKEDFSQTFNIKSNADEKSKQYRDYREQCGIKDPVMLNEIEEAYFEGYQQAEKDLELTWEDVREMCKQSVLVEIDLGRLVSDERHYTEVLKRFKERKEK